LNLQISIYTHE
jgi:hypothetical protein